MYKPVILKMYTKEKLSIQKIAKVIKKSKDNIRNILRIEGVLRKVGESNIKYRLDHNYFDIIDTERKAYFLGLMFADGNISMNRSSFTVRLISKDKYILEQFLLDLNSTAPVYTAYHKKYKKKCFSISLTSERMFKSLNSIGCTPRKSLTLEFPDLDSSLVPHFIRGYFDGDGTVGVYSSKNTSWKRLMSGFCGTYTFLNKLVQYLPTSKKTVQVRKNGLSILSFSVQDSITLYTYMYNNATVFLHRKHAIFYNEIKQRGSETTISGPSRKRIKV